MQQSKDIPFLVTMESQAMCEPKPPVFTSLVAPDLTTITLLAAWLLVTAASAAYAVAFRPARARALAV